VEIFVYEHLCAGVAGGHGAASLGAEGWTMLSAVLADLARLPGVRPVTLLDPLFVPAVRALSPSITPVPTPADVEPAFRKHAARAAFSLVIAPEFDGLLAERCRWVEEAGGTLLGPSASAVRLCGDKFALARHLRAVGVPTPPTPVYSGEVFPAFPPPVVCKPRHGAGSVATFLVRTRDELALCPVRAAGEGWLGQLVVQPYVPGRAASVAFLAGPGRLLALPAAEQTLSDDGRFRYRGGRLPLPAALAGRAEALAAQAARAVQGLHGYFGVDLVLGGPADGSGDAVLEINPRLTTSYAGLRALARFNLAEALLAVAGGSAPRAWQWGEKEIRFEAGGRLL
jgi:predicted ATP-grasp superfamily ATP-dependent carboligase